MKEKEIDFEFLLDVIKNKKKAQEEYKQKSSKTFESCKEWNNKQKEDFLNDIENNVIKLFKKYNMARKELAKKDIEIKKLEKASISMINELKISNEDIAKKAASLYDLILNFNWDNIPEEVKQDMLGSARWIFKPNTTTGMEKEIQDLTEKYREIMNNM